MSNQLPDPTPHLFPYESSCQHPSQYFFEVPPIQVFSPCLPSAFDHTYTDQLLAAFEVHLGMPVRRRGYLNQK